MRLLTAALGVLWLGCTSTPAEEPQSCPTDTTELRRQILIPRCGTGGCHGSAEPAGGLNLAQDELEKRVVGVPSEECGLVLVAPGDPDGSLLIQKVVMEEPPCGERMPRVGALLDAHEVECVRRWIESMPADAGPELDSTPPDAAPDPDAGEGGSDAGIVAPCAAGQMRCGDRCITEIRPTFAALHSRIFGRSCTFNSCHSGTQPKEGLDMLDPDTLHAAIVGVPSRQRPELLRIEPLAPERSYLVNKLEGVGMSPTDSTGLVEAEQMPPEQPLCREKIEVIEAWIRAGAAKD